MHVEESDAWRRKLSEGFQAFGRDISKLLKMEPVTIVNADVPAESGVYVFVFDERIQYIGEAKGSGGLRDRILSKHISGDDTHVLQRVFMEPFPDRRKRREFIKKTVGVKWLVIDDVERISIVERLLIWLIDPPWNRK